jgi:olefin beta-lactone synthetase
MSHVSVGDNFNIAYLLETMASERPFQRAVVIPQGRDRIGRPVWAHLHFADLNRLTDQLAWGLRRRGVVKGDRVSMLVRPCLEFIPLVFAVFKLGAVPVLIDPGMGRKPFLSCLGRMRPRVLVAEPAVHTLRPLFPAAFGTVEVSVTVRPSPLAFGAVSLEELVSGSEGDFPTVDTKSDDEAAILFTSGSTGPAKGVTYTHRIFGAQTRHIQEMYGIVPGEIDLSCFPMFGLFSMAMGMTVVIPDMDPSKPALADPRLLVEAIDSHGCTSAFGSPSIWMKLGPWCIERGVRLPSLRRILVAGAPIPPALHRTFRELLPAGAELHTPYGATESLPVATIGSARVLGETAIRTAAGAGTCVGKLAPGMSVRIMRPNDGPVAQWSEALRLPNGEIGEIVVRGEVVTREYKGEPEQTAAAKLIEVDEDGSTHILHRMGDLGYLDDQGLLWFCGRKSHRVIGADGQVWTTDPVEGIFNEHPDVYRTALIGVAGQPHLAVELRPGRQREPAELAAELRALGRPHSITAAVRCFHVHPGFPVDVRHNSKIERLKVAAWAEGRTPVEVA